MASGKNLKATWTQALLTFFLPIFLISFLRWAVVEPFVIPSGSMLPGLQLLDHVLVKKFSYGLKFPFSNQWVINWAWPRSGEIAVFKYPHQPSVYYIKRVIGTPGDEVLFKDGQLTVNGKIWSLTPVAPPTGSDENFDYFQETSPSGTYIVRYRKGSLRSSEELKATLADGEYFMMGDNRDESMDSRYWGHLPAGLLVGRAWVIMFGCRETLPSNAMLCNPSTLRGDRFWVKVSKD
jgi:signal peptidase I